MEKLMSTNTFQALETHFPTVLRAFEDESPNWPCAKFSMWRGDAISPHSQHTC